MRESDGLEGLVRFRVRLLALQLQPVLRAVLGSGLPVVLGRGLDDAELPGAVVAGGDCSRRRRVAVSVAIGVAATAAACSKRPDFWSVM